VICVTHLAPIAALAEFHHVVEKQVSDGRTFTTVRRLDEAERVRELARMLGGAEITAQAERHAAEMLKAHGSGRPG